MASSELTGMGPAPYFSSFKGGWWGGPAVVSPALRFTPRTDPGSQCWPAGQFSSPGEKDRVPLLGQNSFSEPSPPLLACPVLASEPMDLGENGTLAVLGHCPFS